MREPIICFEGPSGIGKTTLCQIFSETCNIVPEVNLLFGKNESGDKYWYYEKQIERYNLCRASRRKSILDGDIFQPIWYNWIYNFPPNFLSLNDTYQFYRDKLIERKIEFPDKYIVFQTAVEILRERKEKDKTRQRRNFEKHLKLIEPQKQYFKFIRDNTMIEVDFVKFDNLSSTKRKVASILKKAVKIEKNDAEIFESIDKWIQK